MKTWIGNIPDTYPQTARLRPRGVVLAEATGVATWALLCWLLLLRTAAKPVTSNQAAFTVLAIFLGIVLADLGSGFFHWLFDTFFEETTPFLGPHLIAPFREHHRDPLAMTHHGFLELTGNSCIASVPLLAMVWWFGPVEPQSEAEAFNYSLWLSFTFTLTATNQFHRWAHDPSPPRIARWLQRCGLAISPAHHARHHAPPHRSAYCITNGWTNRLADEFSIFTRLERVVVALGIPRTSSKPGPQGGVTTR